MLGLVVICIALSALNVLGDDGASKEPVSTANQTQNFNQEINWSDATSIYDFHAVDIYGKDVPLEKYRDHVLIIVNVASNCGLTETNYKQLVKLYEKYGESKGLRILAFPCNQFAGQEPGTSEEILNFAKGFNVTFDMFEKVDVNGDGAHPLWKWLKKQQEGKDIEWNFTKFIVDKKGNVVSRIAPKTEPFAMEDTLNSYF